MNYDFRIVEKVKDAVVRAGSTSLPKTQGCYIHAIQSESNAQAKWTLETMLQNACIAELKKKPLCDDTGIPHLFLDVGPNAVVTGSLLESIKEGVRVGLRQLPGRPMAVKGDDSHRLEQSLGLYEDPGMVEPAPILIRNCQQDQLKLNVLLFGGGPAIRGKTQRIFHKHNTQVIIDEIVSWATEATAMLGCTPCTLAIGVGRSHYEATALMLQAIVDGNYKKQNAVEQEITRRVNNAGIGPLGLGGETTVFATFMKIGSQRASGVRIVSMRPCCCVEPRITSVIL